VSYFDGFARIFYSPKRLGTYVSPNWWCIAEADPNIYKYYAKLFQYATHGVERLDRCKWAAHITIVRNEQPLAYAEHLWERFAGRDLWFRVYTTMETNGFYYWMPVYCPGGITLRKELGLPPQPKAPFHLTVGHAREDYRIPKPHSGTTREIYFDS
jgi:hypothetical protein